MSDYKTRRSERVDRLNARAATMRQESERRQGTVTRMTDVMAGSPILCGHHSEGRHRRDIDKIHNNMRKSVDAGRKAEEYERRAKAAENNTAISSDDPDAIDALKEKLAKLENLRDRMKLTNKQYRKGGADAITGITEAQRETIRTAMDTKESWRDSQPFEKFEITNLGARIRATKKRIAHLESTAGDVTSEEMHGEITIRDDVENNRLMLLFPGRPSTTVRAALKRHGFRWSPSNEAWQRQRGNSAKYAASSVLKQLDPDNRE